MSGRTAFAELCVDAIRYGQCQKQVKRCVCGSHSMDFRFSLPRCAACRADSRLLQVFQNGTSSLEGFDAKVFEDIPPALCKKEGGAAFRIKCTDDGLPQNKTTLEVLRHLVVLHE